jgi:hypothetical protein
MISANLVTDLILLLGTYYLIGCLIIFTLFLLKGKRSIILYTLFIFSLAILSFIIFGAFIEPNNVIISHKEIELEDYESNIDILVISDLHLGRFNNEKRAIKAIDHINKSKAKYVLILGDTINNTSAHLDQIDVLKKIDGSKKVYIIYGNHDYEFPHKVQNHANVNHKRVAGLKEKFINNDLIILENSSRKINNKTQDASLLIGGIDSIWAGRDKYSFIDAIKSEDTFILMCHNPDCLLKISDSKYKEKVDLVLSGHTHGGEMRLPYIGSISPIGIPTQLPRNYDKGYNEYQGVPIYITSGLGNVGVRMRTFNPPEVVLLTIK